MTDKAQHHYFASCAFGWQIGATEEEAAVKLIERFRTEYKQITTNTHKKGEPGGYFWTCKVEAPIDAEYSIEFYMPRNVKWSEGMHHYTTFVTAKEIKYFSTREVL